MFVVELTTVYPWTIRTQKRGTAAHKGERAKAGGEEVQAQHGHQHRGRHRHPRRQERPEHHRYL